MATKSKKTDTGYKTHQAGSRKGQVHETFDRKGRDAAIALGEKLGLKPSTLATWVNAWGRDAGKKPAAKKSSKSKKSTKATSTKGKATGMAKAA